MHSEIHKFTSGELYEFLELDNDEISLENEIERLMDMLNDHGTVNQIDAIEICMQRGWAIYREYDPAHYYANEHGYLLWVDITRNM